jgi:hypothetical protein
MHLTNQLLFYRDDCLFGHSRQSDSGTLDTLQGTGVFMQRGIHPGFHQNQSLIVIGQASAAL